MANQAGESNGKVLRLDFDRRLMLHFGGSVVTSDAGLLAYRELDDALGLTTTAGEMLADARTGKNGRHALVGLLRQSVFGRLAGYEDVNDAERLRHDPAMRWIVGGKAASDCAASSSQMGRFETKWLAAEKNLSALADLSGQWINAVHDRSSAEGRGARLGFERDPDAWRTVALHAGAPNHGGCRDKRACRKGSASRVDGGHGNAGACLDTKALESLGDHRPRALAHVGSDPGLMVGENDTRRHCQAGSRRMGDGGAELAEHFGCDLDARETTAHDKDIILARGNRTGRQ